MPKNLKRKPSDSDPEKSRYISFDAKANAFKEMPKRPSNQSTPAVVAKVVNRTKDETDPTLMFDSTRAFVEDYDKGVPQSKMFAGRGIDMAHGVSAAEIKRTLVFAVNQHADFDDSDDEAQAALDLEDYVAGFITTDAEDEDDVREHARGFLDKSRPPLERSVFGDTLLSRLNRSSGNLIGGDASTNRSIQQLRDAPRLRDGRMIERMERRMKLQDRYWAKFGVPNPFEARPDAPGKPASSTGDF